MNYSPPGAGSTYKALPKTGWHSSGAVRMRGGVCLCAAWGAVGRRSLLIKCADAINLPFNIQASLCKRGWFKHLPQRTMGRPVGNLAFLQVVVGKRGSWVLKRDLPVLQKFRLAALLLQNQVWVAGRILLAWLCAHLWPRRAWGCFSQLYQTVGPHQTAPLGPVPQSLGCA